MSCFWPGVSKTQYKGRATKNGDLFSIWTFDGKITYEDIIKATENFDLKYCIRTGGYGSVYKAHLPSDKVVALKKLHSTKVLEPAVNKNFQNEVKILRKIRHGNIVKLHGGDLHLYPVSVKTQSGEKLELQLNPGDSVMDIRQFLLDAPETCYFTCYDLLLHTKDGSTHHLEDFNEISEVADITTGGCSLEMVPALYDDRSIRAHIHRTRELLSLSTLDASLSTSLALQYETTQNKASSPGVTLEGNKFCITGTTKMFYVKSSTGNTLDPRPSKTSSEATTLVGLLQKISSKFKKAFREILERRASVHPFENVQSLLPPNSWLGLHPVPEHKRDAARAEDALTLSYGSELIGMQRDWNEELQSCREFLHTTPQERILRDRALYKVTSDFVDAAISLYLLKKGSDRTNQIWSEKSTNTKSPCVPATTIPTQIHHFPLHAAEQRCDQILEKNKIGHLFTKVLWTTTLIVAPESFSKPAESSPNSWVGGVSGNFVAERHGGEKYVHNNIFLSIAVDADLEQLSKKRSANSNIESSSSLNISSDKASSLLHGDSGIPNGEKCEGSSSGERDTVVEVASNVPAETQLTESEQATYASANNDLKGTKADQEADVSGLYNLAMAIIDYRGHRVSVLPSILQGDKSDSLLYGSVDNGKKICWNEDFHSKVLEAAKRLHLKEHTVLDGSGNVFKLAAPVECKGIVGSDDRHYLLDLMRVTPRDANYTGPGSRFCILRPELITAFCQAQAAERSKCKSEGDAHVTTDSSTVVGNITKEGRDENVKDCASSQAETEPRQEILFNPNVFTEFKLSGNQEASLDLEIVEDEENVRKVSSYLTNVVLPKFVQDLCTLEVSPMDGQTLTEALHAHGINVRYIGKVADGTKHLPHLWDLCSNEIVVRSAKHILKDVLRDIEDHDIAGAISHFFNCFFGTFQAVGTKVTANNMQSRTHRKDQGGHQSSGKPSRGQGRWKGGASARKNQSSFMNVSSETLWSDIQEFAKLKYQGPLDPPSESKPLVASLPTKELIINERCLGLDHPDTAHSYGIMALFYHGLNQTELALRQMSRALLLLSLSSGPDHPDVALGSTGTAKTPPYPYRAWRLRGVCGGGGGGHDRNPWGEVGKPEPSSASSNNQKQAKMLARRARSTLVRG
ncbi:isoform 2 of clustered mitochondria protein [Fagus crenata]